MNRALLVLVALASGCSLMLGPDPSIEGRPCPCGDPAYRCVADVCRLAPTGGDGGLTLVEGQFGSGGGAVVSSGAYTVTDDYFEGLGRACAGAYCEVGGISQ